MHFNNYTEELHVINVLVRNGTLMLLNRFNSIAKTFVCYEKQSISVKKKYIEMPASAVEDV